MNEENMRSIVMYGSDNEMLEKLKSLSNWSFLENNSRLGGHPYRLENGENQIHLDIIASNVIKTSGISPQDDSENHPTFKNDILNSLCADLYEKGIQYAWHISDNDKVKLAR